MIKQRIPYIIILLVATLWSCNNMSREEKQNDAIRKSIYNISKRLINPDSIPSLEPSGDFPIEIRLPDNHVLFNPSDAIEVSHYLALETNENIPMSQISEIRFYDKRIFLRDNSRKVIFIFDETGRFVQQIRHNGNGPGEYNRIMSFIAYNHQVLVYDDINKKIHSYSYDDKWLWSKDMAIMFNSFEILPDGKWFLYTDRKSVV